MTQIQLSDTQAVILTAACAREGGCLLPVTASLKGGAVNMVLNSLIKKGLAEEVPAGPGEPVWREDEDGTPLGLRATPAAYETLGMGGDMGADTAPEEQPATDMADEAETPPTNAHGAPEAKPVRKTRPGTKQETLIVLLKRPEGATADQIAEATGWQHHTIRAAISAALKKKLGLTVTTRRIRTEGQGSTTIYRIAESEVAA